MKLKVTATLFLLYIVYSAEKFEEKFCFQCFVILVQKFSNKSDCNLLKNRSHFLGLLRVFYLVVLSHIPCLPISATFGACNFLHVTVFGRFTIIDFLYVWAFESMFNCHLKKFHCSVTKMFGVEMSAFEGLRCHRWHKHIINKTISQHSLFSYHACCLHHGPLFCTRYTFRYLSLSYPEDPKFFPQNWTKNQKKRILYQNYSKDVRSWNSFSRTVAYIWIFVDRHENFFCQCYWRSLWFGQVKRFSVSSAA